MATNVENGVSQIFCGHLPRYLNTFSALVCDPAATFLHQTQMKQNRFKMGIAYAIPNLPSKNIKCDVISCL